MVPKENRFQFKLWLGAVLGSILLFIAIKLVWNEVNTALLLVLLMIGFVINWLIMRFRIKKR